MLTRDTLRKMWPHCPPAIVDGMVRQAPVVFPKYGLTTPLAVAVFMAHCTVECGEGRELVENLSYSAQRMTQVWPRHFPTVASAIPYQHNPRKLANFIYEPPIHKDLGNRAGTDDGYNNRGRGLTNVTGGTGYHALSEKTGRDVVNNPDLVNDPDFILEAGVADFIICNCLEPALQGDMRTSCRRLNGGYVGLSDREAAFRRWQPALAAEHPDIAIPTSDPRPAGVLQEGDSGYEVKAAQQQLASKGYACGADDGEFHEATRDAVLSLQANEGLPTTGVIDEATKAALAAAAPKPVSEDRALATANDLRDAGSQTVASADSLGFIGKLKLAAGAAIAGGGGADQLGLVDLDSVQSGVDKAHQAYGIVDSLKGLAKPILTSPIAVPLGIALAVLGILVIWHSRKVILARLEDHRTGVNLGR